MENETKLREIKVPRGMSLGSKKASEVFDKHKKKLTIALAIGTLGIVSAVAVMEFLPDSKPQVRLEDFVPPMPAPLSEPTAPPAGDQSSPPAIAGPEAAAPESPQPTLPGTANLQGSGVTQSVNTNPPQPPGGVVQQQVKPSDPSAMELITALTERANDQDKKIAQLQEDLNKLRSHAPSGSTKVREARKDSSMSGGNSFDIRKLNLLSISADSAVVRTGAGTTMTVTPGRPFPGGVVFISYDPSSHVMKTTAGEFLIQS